MRNWIPLIVGLVSFAVFFVLGRLTRWWIDTQQPSEGKGGGE